MKVRYLFYLICVIVSFALFIENDHNKEVNQSMQIDKIKLEDEQDVLLLEHSQFTIHIDLLEKKVEDYQAVIIQYEIQIDELIKDKATLEEAITTLAEESQPRVDEITALYEQILVKENEIIQLDFEVTQYKNDITLLNTEINSLEMQLGELQLTITSLLESNELLKNELLISEESYDTILENINRVSETARESNIYILKTLTSKNGQSTSGVGSGVVFKEDSNYYYALTNFHVIDKADYPIANYTITFNSGQEVIAEVIAQGDLSTDLAVIRFPISGEIVPITTLDFSNTVDIEEFIIVIGNPNGLQNVVSTTHIVGINNYLQDVTFPVLSYRFSMNTAGNSGGAVIDIDGKLLGIHTWSSLENGDDKFAIPLSEIEKFLNLHDLI